MTVTSLLLRQKRERNKIKTSKTHPLSDMLSRLNIKNIYYIICLQHYSNFLILHLIYRDSKFIFSLIYSLKPCSAYDGKVNIPQHGERQLSRDSLESSFQQQECFPLILYLYGTEMGIYRLVKTGKVLMKFKEKLFSLTRRYVLVCIQNIECSKYLGL